MEQSGRKHTAAEWDEARAAFRTSIMADVKLSSLAENVGCPAWPIKAAEETPTKYIGLTYDELFMMPEIGPHPDRVDLLIEIIKETIAFDDPFGDMVEQVEESSQREDNILKNVNKLNIPLEFPIALTALTEDTKKFCVKEELNNIKQFVDFSQHMAENIVVGGDFRSFLNSLAHVDEDGIATYLPFRKGSTGFHIPEAINHIVGALRPNQKLALVKRFNGQLTADEASRLQNLSSADIAKLEDRITSRIGEYSNWFKEEKDELAGMVDNARALERYFIVLKDERNEFLAINCFYLYLESTGLETPLSKKKKGGLFGAFSKMFKK